MFPLKTCLELKTKDNKGNQDFQHTGLAPLEGLSIWWDVGPMALLRLEVGGRTALFKAASRTAVGNITYRAAQYYCAMLLLYCTAQGQSAYGSSSRAVSSNPASDLHQWLYLVNSPVNGHLVNSAGWLKSKAAGWGAGHVPCFCAVIVP